MHVAVTTAPTGPNTTVTLTTRMDNTTPDGQSQFIAGPFPGEPVSYGGYRGLISANVPARASHITITGAGPLAVNGAEGPTWVVAAPVTIPQGATSTVVVRFVMPGHQRVDDVGALGPDPHRTVDVGRCDLRRQRTQDDLMVRPDPGTPGTPGTLGPSGIQGTP